MRTGALPGLLLALLLGAILALPGPARADEALADLVEQVAPSVVNLHTSGVHAPRDSFDALFGRAGRWESLGSGFVVDRAEGLVITNAHVVGQASEILVMDHEGRVFDAEVVAADGGIDLALLRVRGLDLPAVTFGVSRGLRVGEDVFAVGNPYGHGHTVTRGILSARSRQLGREEFDLFLQTDAAINPGSSGGPLFDLDGRVVGVATAVDGRAEAIAFAMPVELVLGALPVLEAGRDVEPGWPGLRLSEVRGGGLEVAAVYDQGPADQAGLGVGDRIVSVDGATVRGRAAWLESFGAAFPGDERTLLITRKGKDMVRKLTLGSREDWATRVAGKLVPIEGMYVSVRAVAPDVADRMGSTGGVQVVEAQRGAFFNLGDVVLEVNGQPIKSTREMVIACDGAMDQRSMTAIVYRQGGAVRTHRRW
jgi:serine protease Do